MPSADRLQRLILATALVLSGGLAHLGCGRNHETPNQERDGIVDKQQAVVDQTQALVDRLLEVKDAASLEQLLELNRGRAATATGNEEDQQVVAPIEEAVAVQSSGGKYIVVVAHRRVEVEESPKSIHPQVAVVFNEQGRLLATLGGGVAADGENVDRVSVLDLGSSSSWFVWVSRFERHASFAKQSDIYVVAEHFPRAFRVYHHANSAAFTTEPEGSGTDGQYFLFDCPEGARSEGPVTGRDGLEHRMPIYWHADSGFFRGPSHITKGAVACYEVDLALSHAFQPTDLASDAGD
jgi:hypothetical protein